MTDQQGGLGEVSGLVVEMRSVSRIYQTGAEEVVALHDLSLTVARGEVVALVGPSGSGKTTILNLIAGLDRSTRGEIEVLGRWLNAMSEGDLARFRAQSIGLVFQDPHLLPGLTALENVTAARLPWGQTRQVEAHARELLRLVGLDHRIDHPPSRMSGGERQRVGLARALVGDPELLLADEPTGNLDAATTDELVILLASLRATRGLTLMIATHDPSITRVADRLIELGRLPPRVEALRRFP